MMHYYRLIVVASGIAAILSVSASAQAPQSSWTQVGSLACKVDPNVGFIIVGHQPMQCTFTPGLAPAPPQYYDSAINTGDVGVSAGSILAWGVFAPTAGIAQARSPASMSARPATLGSA
jgi:hypothetical protein